MFCPRCYQFFENPFTFCPYDGVVLVSQLQMEPSDEPPPVEANVIWGRYRLGGVIGEGSMARVYAARDLHTDQPVAVKLLSRRYADSERERRRFFREARVARSIDHPNVVKVLDVGRDEEGHPFLVIDYLRGESLGTLVRRERQLSPDLALPLLRDAAAGLEAVHDAGIVHRDVKPDNIFLVGLPGVPSEVKLVDFGLAKLHAHHSSQTGTTLGTAAYMPPEQVVSEATDARADVYSLGVVLFRVLTGYLPFEGDRSIHMLAHQVLLPMPPPSWFVETLDPRIDAVVLKATKKDPVNRYPSMSAMLEDLRRLTDGASGEVASPKNSVEPDVYLPKTELGRDATKMFCNTLGIAIPEWLEG